MANPRILERFRKSKTDLNQKEFASELGLSPSTYQRLIDGASPFTMDIIQKAAKIFKVDPREISEESFVVNDPEAHYARLQQKRTVLVSIELDGTAQSLKYWVDVLKRMNAALA